MRESLSELLKNDPLRLAGATAFFTTFALPPILFILIQILKLILKPQTIRQELNKNLTDIVGPETVKQIIDVLRALRNFTENWWLNIAGFVFLLFVATTLFKVIRNSINQVWKIRASGHRGLVRTLGDRLQSIIVIVVAAVLFIVGIAAEAVQAIIENYLADLSTQFTFYFKLIVNTVTSLVIVTTWFMMVFRYLPDGRPSWPVAIVGSLFTSVLFTIGKIILHFLLSYSNINSFYGTSASIVLLLLFVFYSSLILYFGAAFTKIWAIHRKTPITPRSYATCYRVILEEEHH